MAKGIGYWLYQRGLEVYRKREQNGNTTPYSRLFRGLIRIAAMGLMRWKRVSFPTRATGGWWWIWRFRFELLMGWFEKESVRFCRELIRPGMTVVDIGAHIGYYSRIFSELVGPRGRVLAFEASPENFVVLQRNLTSRKYGNVEAFQYAVSDRNGVLPLYVSPGHSNHSLLPGYTEAQDVVQIQSIALDSFLSERKIEKVDFIKSDTEGAEPLVLAGMRQTVTRSHQLAMLMEYNPTAIRCGGTESEELIRSLEGVGFVVRAIFPDGSLGAIPRLAEYEYINILCRKLVPPQENAE